MKPIDGEISEALLIKLQSSFSKKQNTLDLKNYSVVGTGSGYLVDKNGHIVTNEHVVNGCSVITTGKNNTAELLRADATNDIAIIKTTDTEKYRPMSFADKDPALGQRIFVSGFPLNQILENLNFTSGTVSSEVGLMQNINQFQFTAPIQPGNSGGPILNEYGGVIGMSVATVSNKKFEEMVDTLVQNINFGIRQSSIQSLLDQESIKYETGNPKWFKNEESVAEEAKAGTVLIKCWNLN
jgi:S1-C subfamily serine protease